MLPDPACAPAQRVIGAFPAIVLLFAAVSAQAQVRAPSDAEGHAAYCIPIVKAELDAAQKAVAAQEKSLAEIHAAAGSASVVKPATEVYDNLRGEELRYRALLERLQSYLRPRVAQLDPVALSAAEKGGEAHWRNTCNDPTWLP